ncbi:MAG: hypothetical protein L6R37_001398 [Teloschistes peruensis]|nr:MAG: hypothetical protein L6R37_001398 [Teloschistes peruensis]
MAPSTVPVDNNNSDNTSTAPLSNGNGTTSPRTLLLSPPSLASHPERLDQIFAAHDRSATDIQMLDRLSLSLVHLPDVTYDIVLILLDADNTRAEPAKLLTAPVLAAIARSLKPGGKLEIQDGGFATADSAECREAIFAGLVVEGDSMVKPTYSAAESVPLRLGGKKQDGNNAVASTSAAGTGALSLNLTGKRKNGPAEAPAGVGFVLPGDDLGVDNNDDDDDELIDENDLLSDEDKNATLLQPPECRPQTRNKRRRACKDCTCGLAERLSAEDAAKRSAADQTLAKLKAEELSEVDFTVQGKVGSCGNCALGDAFRCDGCPYIGQPAFKPGEEVRILNEVQL